MRLTLYRKKRVKKGNKGQTWGVGFVQDLLWSINPPPQVTTLGTPLVSARMQGVATVDLKQKWPKTLSFFHEP